MIRTRSTFRALAAGLALLATGLAACGGDEDETPAAPTATTTPAASGYRAQAKDLAEKLNTEVGKALADMLAAQTSQGDPKWPTTLTADADLVIRAATRLKDLKAPGEDAKIGEQLTKAADKAAEGGNALKVSVEKADQAQGAVAFASFNEAQGTLKEAIAQLR